MSIERGTVTPAIRRDAAIQVDHMMLAHVTSDLLALIAEPKTEQQQTSCIQTHEQPAASSKKALKLLTQVKQHEKQHA